MIGYLNLIQSLNAGQQKIINIQWITSILLHFSILPAFSPIVPFHSCPRCPSALAPQSLSAKSTAPLILSCSFFNKVSYYSSYFRFYRLSSHSIPLMELKELLFDSSDFHQHAWVLLLLWVVASKVWDRWVWWLWDGIDNVFKQLWDFVLRAWPFLTVLCYYSSPVWPFLFLYFLHMVITNINLLLQFFIPSQLQSQLAYYAILFALNYVHSFPGTLSLQENQKYNNHQDIPTCALGMATVNRLKHRKKNTEQSPATQPQPQQQVPNEGSSPLYKSPLLQPQKHAPQKQQQYESYYQLAQCNPSGVSFSSTVFPHSTQLYSNYHVPLGLVISPVLSLENEGVDVMQRSADRLPRCALCRSYMNCYNRVDKRKFLCFVCNRENQLDKDYDPNDETHLEMKSSIYQCLGASNYYTKEPAEEVFVFLIDITQQAASTRMLYYAVAAMKEVLARPEFDDLCIYFFTYDELVQEYDFSGADIRCTINDQTIEGQLSIQSQSAVLRDVRDKLFELLDALQDISTNNPRKGSNFTKCFQFVFSALKHTSAKFFILQCNESIIGEQMFKEQPMKQGPNQPPIQPNRMKGPSLFESCNKTFMVKYGNQVVNQECSFAFFTFSRNYKNLKVVSDVFKLTNSEMKVYAKDSASELDQFYYDIHYLLGTTYFKGVKVELTINTGWHFTAVYGNFYRTKQYIVFQIPNCDPSRKLAIMVAPSNNIQYGGYIPPYLTIQIITNYQYKRQSYLCVATLVQPVTGYIEKLYPSIDTQVTCGLINKGIMSTLRLDDINNTRKKIANLASQIYLGALEAHKRKPEQVPDSVMTILMTTLGFLKSLVNNTPIMDKILSERLFLQSSGYEISTYFNPYLFNLSELEPNMCQNEDFQYPPTVDIKFHNVKSGLFLMDVGLALYLFIAKDCDPHLLTEVLGKPKFNKNDEINEEVLMGQTGEKAVQVQNLIKFLRQQKSYGWIPLHIIRCGQSTTNERSFYLFFYGQKYQQFRSYRMNLQQYIAMISKPNSF